MRKKVLIFSLAYLPNTYSGAELAVKEKTDRMPDIEFHLICARYDAALPREERIGNVQVHRIGLTRPHPTIRDLGRFPLHINKYWYQVAAFFTALRLHRTHRFDAIWALMAHSAGIPAALFKRVHPSVPFVLELQEGDPPERIERIMLPVWPLFARAFTSADVVSVISTFLGQWAKRRGFPGEPALIPNAVDTKHFSADCPEAEISAIRDHIGKNKGDVFLITTSRLVHKNAIDDVIRALPLLPAHVHFLVLGTGPEEAKLCALAQKERVEGRVLFLGRIDHRDLPKYLKACDIFVRASRSEGMGSSFIEAMAAGLPVIATHEGGIADFLFDAVRNPGKPTTGWVVDKDTPEQIAAAIRTIIEDPEQARAIARTAKQMVVEKYDWDLIAREMREKVFEPLWRD